MRLSRCLVVAFSLVGTCEAQLPDFYKTVSRVTWVVENIDKVRPAWAALGLSGIQEFPNIQLVGQFRGKPITIYAWQITGYLGNLTVDMIQPGEGQANIYNNFHSKHGDGILSIVARGSEPAGVGKRNSADEDQRRRRSAAGHGGERNLHLLRY